jgi:thiosulfate/3-mercaptopyruvate sulfurtransferase
MHRTLIDTQTLARHVVPRTASGWRVVDCRAVLQNPDEARAAYAAGHLPGAVFADLEEDLSGSVVPGSTGRHPLPDRAALAARLSAWGIGNDTQIVAYDAGPGMFAARLWWLVRWLGHDAVAVLDGGLAAWQRAGMPVSTDTPAIEPAEFAVRDPLTHVVSTREVAAALPDLELLDARDEARFRAEQEPIDPVAGHIPGAYCLPFQGNLRGDGSFRAADELRTRFAPHVASGRPVVCYCGSGVTAAHNVLAMVHGGLPEPALYAGSWSEWIVDPARPVER